MLGSRLSNRNMARPMTTHDLRNTRICQLPKPRICGVSDIDSDGVPRLSLAYRPRPQGPHCLGKRTKAAHRGGLRTAVLPGELSYFRPVISPCQGAVL